MPKFDGFLDNTTNFHGTPSMDSLEACLGNSKMGFENVFVPYCSIDNWNLPSSPNVRAIGIIQGDRMKAKRTARRDIRAVLWPIRDEQRNRGVGIDKAAIKKLHHFDSWCCPPVPPFQEKNEPVFYRGDGPVWHE